MLSSLSRAGQAGLPLFTYNFFGKPFWEDPKPWLETSPLMYVGNVTTPTLVLIGDDDIIELAHTVTLFEALPAGQLAVVPRTSHMVPMEAPQDVAHLVRDFLTSDVPPQTLMPSRRRVART